MALIVIRLRPAEPIEESEFSDYLDGLTIQLRDVGINAADGVPIGQADASTGIAQHTKQVTVPGIPPAPPTEVSVPMAAATAVIEAVLPPGHGEHGTSDVRLEITRNGGTIVHDQVYFSVPMAAGALPDPSDFQALEPSSIFLALPPPGQEVSLGDAFVALPSDGTPPRFDDLLGAVNIVLAGDPGGVPDPAALTPAQASHVASEIVWNTKFRPLPAPDGATLEQMYTVPDSDDEEIVAARSQFEGELTAHYATGNAEAMQLAGFVYALAAAVGEQRLSEAAPLVGFLLPVLPGNVAETGAQIKSVRVLLTDETDPRELGFAVPAPYFYALGATMASSMTLADRYRLATLEDEQWLVTTLRSAVDSGVIDEDPAVNVEQAARRLRSLGAVGGVAPRLALDSDPNVQALVRSWLDYADSDIMAFWRRALTAPEAAGHLTLVLQALTDSHRRLIDAIKNIPVATVEELRNRTASDWRQLFGVPVDEALLPAFTEPGSPDERVEAFIRHARQFFEVDTTVEDPATPVLGEPPRFRPLANDPFTDFAARYEIRAGTAFEFGGAWDESHLLGAVNDVFSRDSAAEAWLEQAVRTIDELTLLAAATPAELRFSVMEALYARGFTSRDQVLACTREEFPPALTGTVAYEHAELIYDHAGTANPHGQTGDGEFHPVNPDGCLVDCIPPPHRSPFGPVAYLHELLDLSTTATCEHPDPGGGSDTLGDLLAQRRGPLSDLRVTPASLQTPLPLRDLANESLEAIAATLPAAPAGAVHDTANDRLAGHDLLDPGDSGPGHDPATLFAAVPEHSTPATPVAAPDAYDKLRADFSDPALPYPQALDVNRTYLSHLRTDRYAAMRHFRRDITELVLDPTTEPAGFQRHLWRYPVRIDTACEYLGISAEEYALLYTTDIAHTAAPGQLVLWELYGFPAEEIDGRPWTRTILRLPEFLARTGLTYCQFRELWTVDLVAFSESVNDSPVSYPECEPCHLDDYAVHFADPIEAMRRLAVILRLWRTLRAMPGGGYSLTEIRDICDVLRLYNADGSINPDFIRQLAALQMLRDDFGLALTDGTGPVAGATGADRTRLLALWAGPSAQGWDWALDELLDQVQRYAVARHRCGCRPPDFIKLLAENMDPLSRLAGFAPDLTRDTWHAAPTHTLRFAEVLAKIYASDFGIGEVLYLFTADEHLDGDDAFTLQPPNEALGFPLDLPDDETPFALQDLRQALLAVHPSDEDATAWSWPRIDMTLRAEFGYDPPVGPDPLVELGEHFFPSIVAAAGHTVGANRRQYRAPLVGTPPLLWNTPLDGPFRYDAAAGELWTELPLTDEAVIAKLSRMRQLTATERAAVQGLYFAPRAALAPFSFLFADFGEAQERLIQEPDEARRWAYFQRSFASAYARCRIIAEHLARHVTDWTGRDHEEGFDLAWRLLTHLYGDENRATGRWEDDSGEPPGVTWPHRPTGGAFAALLGLIGTGLLGEFTAESGSLLWREVRGPLDAFGAEENAANAPVPTVLPAMDLTLTAAQQQFVSARNGFTIENPNGDLVGGAQGFTVRWNGILLIEADGSYTFRAGAPTPRGEQPDFAAAEDKRWRVALRRGQRSWVLLSHDWPDESAPAECSAPLSLRRGAYQITVELTQPQPVWRAPEDVCPISGGFQLKYAGPDSDGVLVAVPRERLFLETKRDPLDDRMSDSTGGAARWFLESRYVSTLRDIRRSYQRAFKTLLFAHRFGLSAQPVSDDRQSEIGYLLSHPDNFAGTSYYRVGGGFAVHKAYFDPNLLPLRDNYFSPTRGQDQRAAPSARRIQALFDWWERIFDYTVARRDARTSPERPMWLLFHEAAENHPDDPTHLLRHLGVDLLHAPLVSHYFEGYDVTSADLEDERWAVRAWHADRWLRAVRGGFLIKDIRDARPDLWASDDPGAVAASESDSGNAILTRFVRDGCIENDEPRRYQDLERLNDGLRERGRAALLAYLCGMDRVGLPWGGFATEPLHLSELLLLDVQAGGCQRASRIEEAISAVQAFVQRARMGLEPEFGVTAGFAALWDRRFATYRVWEACQRRRVYLENWVEWDEIEHARRGEAFRLLESELRRAALTVPVPGALEYWPDLAATGHPGVASLQAREPARLQPVEPEHHGFDLLATRERHARRSWLATVVRAGTSDGPIGDDRPGDDGPSAPNNHRAGHSVRPHGGPADPDLPRGDAELPLWVESAVRLGVRFLRVAAAAEPPASTTFTAHHPEGEPACCCRCGATHPATVDEYYFWLLDAEAYEAVVQDAGWSWYGDTLPELLHWGAGPAVRLAWSRVHNGEFTVPRQSAEAIRVSSGALELVPAGRTADSLTFQVTGGGLDPLTKPGFRYDMATDTAVVLPLVVEPPVPVPSYPGQLPAYPYFAYYEPGAPLAPTSLFAPAVTVAGSLRAHCQFEAALKWYELYFPPLHSDSSWLHCESTGKSLEAAGCCHDTIITTAAPGRQRSIVLHYLETLLGWADAVMRRNTPEAFQQARLIYQTAARLLGQRPRSVEGTDDADQPERVADFAAHHAPINPRLMLAYEQTEDRLDLIHACLNAGRLRHETPTIDMPHWGDSPMRDGWQTTTQACLDDADWCSPQSPYRFLSLSQSAQQLAAEVRGLGSALLSAYEKGDAEYLATLRTSQEQQLLNLALQTRQDHWRDADWQVQALRKTKEISQTRHRYYTLLIQNGLSNREFEFEALTYVALALRTGGNVSEGIAQLMCAVPDVFVGMLPFTQLPVGTKLAGLFSALGRISNTSADMAGTTGGLRLTKDGWERREEEWRHQVEVLDIELEQIERQILGAERRRDVALRELNSHCLQLEQSHQVQEFLREKFTSHDLFLWLQQETAALHQQMYELALHTARQAQRAFNYERGHTSSVFVTGDAWDHLREGLLAGERLQLGLQQMEHAYLDGNRREYELTKHLSLRLHFPLEFLRLQATGSCEIDVPEWMFDLDHPGHYLRRIKNMTVTIPCVVGPYTGVHARLTLLSSTTRVHPHLVDPPHACCANGAPGNGYAVLRDDARIVRQYAATEAIATSGGQNDAGLFELSFGDPRYLPFEFAGAVSRWRLELPRENNQFDIDTVADVVLHMNYTAREGGDILRRAANELAQRNLPGAGVRYFDVRSDLPDAWHLLQGAVDGRGHPELPLRLTASMFGYLPAEPDLRLNGIDLFVEAPGADRSAHLTVEFQAAAKGGGHAPPDHCDAREIRCVASADWPGLYHGVLDNVDLGPLPRNTMSELGTFRFPAALGQVSRAFLFCKYTVHADR